MDSSQTELEQILISRIERAGPITFRDFMQSALYDERFGYYNTERLKIGAEGDYYTASNVHAAFGAVLAQAFVELWQRHFSDSSSLPFTIIEVGAGTGQMAFDILTALRDEHTATYQHLSYVINEASAALRARQREKLARFAEQVEWRELQELEPVTAIVFSNELVDALPVHRARFVSGRVEEQYVGVEQGSEPGGAKRLSPFWAEASTERLAAYIERMNVSIAEGQIIEVSLDAINWLAEMARAINKGLLITIDYGDLAAHLYGRDRVQGTLRAFHRHRLIDSPFERVGEQDITASVSFTALIEYGRDFGFETLSYERQTAFLIRNGLIDRVSAMQSSSGALDDLKERLAIKNLFVPGGISDNFRVLIQKIDGR